MDPYPSPLLFHGPGACEAALEIVPRLGRLLHEPFGEDGLKIAESREIVELMGSTPVGDVPGVLVVGPLCRAPGFSTDVLLKSIEEYEPSSVRPVLWAFDEAEVSRTIRSRCLRRWCPGRRQTDPVVEEAAKKAVGAALEGDNAGLIEALKDTAPRDVLEAAAALLRDRGIDERVRPLWESVRAKLRYRDPTATEALAAFLGGSP